MNLHNAILARYKKIQAAQATMVKTLADLKRSEIKLEYIIAESNKAILENRSILEQIEIGDRMDKISAEFSRANNERMKALQNLKVLVS